MLVRWCALNSLKSAWSHTRERALFILRILPKCGYWQPLPRWARKTTIFSLKHLILILHIGFKTYQRKIIFVHRYKQQSMCNYRCPHACLWWNAWPIPEWTYIHSPQLNAILKYQLYVALVSKKTKIKTACCFIIKQPIKIIFYKA